MSSKPGEAVIAGDGPFVLLSQNPEMYLLHKGDGTVWCKWPDGKFVEVVPKADLARAAVSIGGVREEHLRYRVALEQIESCPDDSSVLRDIARNALRRKPT